jgi:hypothetical protein
MKMGMEMKSAMRIQPMFLWNKPGAQWHIAIPNMSSYSSQGLMKANKGSKSL